MREFAFIHEHLIRIAGEGAESLADDCAWIANGEGWIVVSTDTSIEGVHFPKSVKGAAATERAVRVAASDIAAKGVDQIGMLVALSVPQNLDPRLPRGFALGIEEAARALGLPLIGGDTTSHDGPLTVTVTVMGKSQKKLLRSGARAGEALYLSGPIGDAALGLRYLQGRPIKGDGMAFTIWENAFLRPEIDFTMGQQIAAVATSSIDVSDGLLADAAQIAHVSEVGINMHAEALPFSAATEVHARSSLEILQHLVTAGDDYRVLFSAPKHCPIGYYIGDVVDGEGVRLLSDGKDITPTKLGYTH